MKKIVTAIKDGIIKALKTGFSLLKVMLPIYLLVVILKYSPVMPWMQKVSEPVMKLFNLPSEAAVPIITGAFTDEYGVVAAISSFSFSTAAITTIAMITLMFHSMPVETAIAQKIGFKSGYVFVYRLVMAVLVGIFVGWIGGLLNV
ncbi:MAG: nucleoside recognition domain-containing protein [Anaerovoracaceae bacterium]